MSGLHDMSRPPFVFGACCGRAQGFGLTPKLAKIAAVFAALGRRVVTQGWARA